MTGTPERVFETLAMRTYRLGWSAALFALVAVGAAMGVASVGWASVLGITACLGVLGAAFGVAWVEPDGDRRTAGWAGARYGAAGAVMVAGLPAILDGWTVAVLIAVAATAPPVAAWLRGALGGGRGSAASAEIVRMGDRDLVERWRASYDELSRPTLSTGGRLRIVEERERLLDELERRDPRRLRAWLAQTAELPPARPGRRRT